MSVQNDRLEFERTLLMANRFEQQALFRKMLSANRRDNSAPLSRSAIRLRPRSLIDLFHRLISSQHRADSPEGKVLLNEHSMMHVMGIGGIGKTELLRAFGAICDEYHIPWVRVIADQEPSQIVASIYDGLTSYQQAFSDMALPRLRDQQDRYHALDQSVRNSIPRDVVRVIRRGVGPRAEQALSQLYYLLGQADADFYLTPSSQYARALVEDLSSLEEDRLICLMFDGYEHAPPYLDKWIRDELIVRLFPNLASKVIVVTSGRRPRPSRWAQWTQDTLVLDLQPLSIHDIRELLRRRGITSPDAVTQISSFAHGLPLAATMAVDVLRESDSSDLSLKLSGGVPILDQLVRKLTEDTPSDLSNWIEQCAVVRWFNDETLQRLIDIPAAETAQAYFRLGQLSFVREHPYGLAIHDLVRDLLCEQVASKSHSRYVDLNQNAVRYYESLLGDPDRQDVQALTIEATYHLLRADEAEGFNRLQELFENATDFNQAEFSALLLDTAEGLRLEGEHKLWIEYFEGALARQQNTDNQRAAQLLRGVLSNDATDGLPNLGARASSRLAMALWYLGEFEAALQFATQGLKLSRSQDLPKFANRALEALGLTYDRLGQFSEAIQTQRELQQWTQQSGDQMGEAWALNNLGYFNWHSGAWSEAKEYLSRCRQMMIDLRSNYGLVYPLCHLGLLSTLLGRLSEAQDLLTESLRICIDEKNREIHCKTLQNLTDLRLAEGRPDEALVFIEEAIEISLEMSHLFYQTDSTRRRGDVFVALKRYDEAAVDYRASLELARALGVRYTELRTLASLKMLQTHGVMVDDVGELDRVLTQCEELHFYNVASDFAYAEGCRLIAAGKLRDGQQWHLRSLRLATKYNRFWLYDRLQILIDYSETIGADGAQLLSWLADSWITIHANGEIPEADELSARESQPDLIPLPPLVTSQLRDALGNSRHNRGDSG